ncbi:MULTISPECIES: GNAT family N-acetyltransferase [Nonomuraea]|uniref:GNAT family N-acetyltransferase n=1 Tax=Nonomuraea ferruginea TaxID=46174 RepID=A0ABT4T4B1_9ACTN|nr:GNAT family N-acetyltransferase [Nonomuraea ferruginea]MDA0644334.1 GNAT family N-acetyltransferase [Nonomuraea ferruginea]
MDIRRVTRSEAVEEAGHLFDAAPQRFADEGCHLLVAYVDGFPAGMVTGVEMTHPGKGTEMFLYELSVDDRFRGRGIGRSLVTALARLARERGCQGLWTATGEDDRPADDEDQAVHTWEFGRP